jgi:hypothetical protein
VDHFERELICQRDDLMGSRSSLDTARQAKYRQIGSLVWMALAGSLLLGASGCGASGSANAPRTVRSPLAAVRGPAFGLTEDNPNLLWSPSGTQQPPAPFQAAAAELRALNPTYLRLLIDWATLQPQPGSPPELQAPGDGCARQVGPCGAYRGIGDELAAIASEQRSQRAAGQDGFQVVIDIYGAPAWAALEPSGCELGGTTYFSRPLRADAIASYRALIGSLLELAASHGVALQWWSPWNEPNSGRFISPQRSACDADSPPLAPGIYAELASAMASELQGFGGVHHMIIGELASFERYSPHTTSIAEFIGALPTPVICLADVFSLHDYATYGSAASTQDPVSSLEAALDARGRCGATAPIWVTETGAGAPRAGQPRRPGAAAEHEGCVVLANQLIGWYADPRIGAVFQYTFRQDPAFPVGLISADLTHLYPTYSLWLAWARARAAGQPPPTPQAGCA